MRKLLVLLVGSLMMVLAADQPDFTGNWTLNVGRSKFGKMPKPQSMTLTAAKKGEVLHSVQTTEDGQGKRSVEGDWFLDGKQHPVDPAATTNKQTQMSKWDGMTLVSERRGADGSYLETIHMMLSGDGKTATERVNVKSPNGNNTSTLIWERK